ncbi:hypothetical protein SH501x_004392 [Pirellulaceae bacterium SH501]
MINSAPVKAAWNRWIQIGTTAVAALVIIALLPSWRQQTMIAPGPLSHSHAQLLSSNDKDGKHRIDTKSRCAACHPNALTDSDQTLLRAVHSVDHPIGVGAQSQLCLQCHAETMPNAIAGTPHDLIGNDLKSLLQSISHPAPTSRANETLECSQCHREHRGSNEDLKSITSARCQSCHRETFESFSKGHPEFVDYPAPAPRSIPFNHQKHKDEYFAKKQTSFDCKVCHQSGDKSGVVGNVYRSVSFERACATCHTEPLQSASSEGTIVLQLPSLDRAIISNAGFELGAWPESASQIMDGEISPLWEALLQRQPGGNDLIQRLPNSKRIQDVDPRDRKQLETLVSLADLMRKALREWNDEGQTVFREAVSGQTAPFFSQTVKPNAKSTSSSTNVPPSTIASVTFSKPKATAQDRWLDRVSSGIPTDLVRQAYQRWFGSSSATEVSEQRIKQPQNRLAKSRWQPPGGDDDLLGAGDDSLLTGENDLLNTPARDGLDLHPSGKKDSTEPLKPWKHMPFGGWMLDDSRVALVYIPQPHADPWLSRWLEWQAIRGRSRAMDAHSPPVSTPEVSATMHLEKQCLQCHNLGVDALLSEVDVPDAAWTIRQRSVAVKQLTRFNHTAHLTITNLRNCESCHVLAGSATVNELVGSQGWSENGKTVHHEFLSMKKSDCSGCHQRKSAGDQCTQCHNYHVHTFQKSEQSTFPVPSFGTRDLSIHFR